MRPSTFHRPSQERGIALIAAVLVVMLSALLIVTYMATTTGERAISSNVHTAKEALYAADAGVRTQQQAMANLAQTKIDSCVAGWAGSGMIIGTPANLFPSGVFTVSSTNPRFTATATIAYSDTDLTPQNQTFYYRYTIQCSCSSSRCRTAAPSGSPPARPWTAACTPTASCTSRSSPRSRIS